MSKGPLCTVLVVALIAGCKSAPSGGNPVGPASGCSASTSHNAPVVCVDGSSGSIVVSPDPIQPWNRKSAGSGTPTIQWLTKPAGGNLEIAFANDDCVATPKCKGTGHCSLNVKSGLGVGARPGSVIARCKYTVTLDGKRLDPESIIIACCSEPAP